MKLINPLIALPQHKEIAGPLLDLQYKLTTSKVDAILDAEPCLNFVTDESSNIRRQRVQNLCINTASYGAFYIRSETLGAGTLNGEWNAN
jgi:hypothetical protein